MTSFERSKFMCVWLLLLVLQSLCADDDVDTDHSCHYNIDIIQTKELSSSPITSMPLVADIDADGSLDIVIASFDGIVNIVQGVNLKQLSGSQWPYQFINSRIQSSPLLFDINGDGIQDIVICTADGDIEFFKLDGTLMSEKTIKIPPLRVSRWWFNEGSQSVDVDVQHYLGSEKRTNAAADAFIAYDAHILATPTLADLDGDGRTEELALPVSYYVEPDSLRSGRSSTVVQDVVGGALVIINMTSGLVTHEIPLHLSKQSEVDPAFLLHPPTVVDLDSQHSSLEVIIATASGLLHVIDHKGQTRSGFPVQLDSAISGQVSVDDIDGDGSLEMIVIETSGIVSCLDFRGNKKWTSKLSGTSFPGSRLADLNGDGVLDVIIPSDDGYVWALSGRTGNHLSNWPVHLGSRLVSNVVITSLSNSSRSPDIIASGFDGNLFIISTSDASPCIEVIDLAERSLTPVQLVDIHPSTPGKEILAATIHGSVMVMSSQSEDIEHEDGGRADGWSDVTNDGQFTYKRDKHGVFITEETKLMSYVSGTDLAIDFDIVDNRSNADKQTYVIQVFAGSVCLHPPTKYSKCGRYSLEVAILDRPITTLLEVHMTNQHGQLYLDSYPVNINTRLTDDIQWLLVIPMVAMAILLLLVYGYPEVDLLPTSHSTKDR